MSLLLLAGCLNLRGDPDNSVSQADPETGSCRLTVAPGWVDFGSLEVASLDEPVQQELVFKNEGDALCEISDVRLSGESEHFSLEVTGDMNLEPGLLSTVLVSYWPVTAAEDSVSVVVESNDVWGGDLEVPLDGQGLAPRLEISPSELDLGGVELGCQTSQELAVHNTGNRNLVIDGFRYTAESEELLFIDDVDRVNGPFPWTLKPGESNPVWVEFHPIAEGEITGSLFMDSNDPLSPTLMATQTGTGVIGSVARDTFSVEADLKLDILFAIDMSDSMWDAHTQLQDSFPALIQALEDEGVDYQVAAVIADHGCVVGSVPFIHGGQSATLQAQVFETQACYQYRCDEVGSNNERAFMLLEQALDNSGAGECNEGLLRGDADLSLVGVSDEHEQSVEPWTYYVSDFQGRLDSGAELRVFGIGGDHPGGCGGDEAEAYDGIYEAGLATGGAVFSFCKADWDSHMQRLVALSLPDRSTWGLGQQPLPWTIEVQVDGVPRTSGWSYDAESNSVVFADDSLPARGAEVLVDYAVAGDCPAG